MMAHRDAGWNSTPALAKADTDRSGAAMTFSTDSTNALQVLMARLVAEHPQVSPDEICTFLSAEVKADPDLEEAIMEQALREAAGEIERLSARREAISNETDKANFNRVVERTVAKISRALDDMVRDLPQQCTWQMTIELVVAYLMITQPWLMRYRWIREAYAAATAERPATVGLEQPEWLDDRERKKAN
jgi:hypothetical protein